MNITQIEEKVKALVTTFDPNTFIYELLDAYGKPKASISRLKVEGTGGYNLSKEANTILWKNQLYYQSVKAKDLHSIIDEAHKSDSVAKHSPRFIIVTNNKDILAIDTKTKDTLDSTVGELHRKFDFFLPWAGLEKKLVYSESTADVKAAEKMAKLFDLLRENNDINDEKKIHALNVFLSRLLFCYFAEDTGIFTDNLFTNSVQSHTQEDGSDLADYLEKLFKVMNVERRKDIPRYLDAFPYVNGGLFTDTYKVPTFNRKSRKMLIECGGEQWSEINPDIFGSMIQAVVRPDQRGNMGMHYTSVTNIMKVIEPLFLNDLKADFEKNYDSPKRLEALLLRLAKIKIFDPACGSGNFLIIAYKEMRRLEMEIFNRLKTLIPQMGLALSGIQLTQFHGIELDDFAHEIAILSLWLAEHQMNVAFKTEFGQANPSLPLKNGGGIVCNNAIRIDWKSICPISSNDEVYILGNPPYIGARNQDDEQKIDLENAFEGHEEYKNSDYVVCWFLKAAAYISGQNAKYAFVSTNSICQGEQVAYLWPRLFDMNLEIGFAHTSFKWVNHARNNAGVTCVIVGIRNVSAEPKTLFLCNSYKLVPNISPYLTAGKNIYVRRSSLSLSGLPKMVLGSMARDDGNLILTNEEKDNLLRTFPESKKILRKMYGTQEFISGLPRWCLWIEDSELDLAMSIPFVRARINAVYEFRMASKAKTTNAYAKIPHMFAQRCKKSTGSIIVPKTSSERREYIPMGYMDGDVVISDSAMAIAEHDPVLFGMISSKIHMIWVRTVGGQLETRLRYSAEICYNTFPFPSISKKLGEEVAQAALELVQVRERHPEKSIEDLYDPDLMPEDLREQHQKLDLIVERCYQSKRFNDDEERLEMLFSLYEKMNEEANG